MKRAIMATSFIFLSAPAYAEIARVQIATGTATAATSISITMGSSPTNGNFLVIGCGLTGTVANQISSISQTGATWVMAVSTAIALGAGVDNEIWYAANVSSASTAITVNLSLSLSGACHAVEYSGIRTISPLDKTASATDSDAISGGNGTEPQTGTTATTSIPNELWFGSINNSASTTTGAPTNSFSYIAQASVAGSFQSSLQKIVSANGTAQTTTSWGGPPPLTYAYAGNIATFKEAIPTGAGLHIQQSKVIVSSTKMHVEYSVAAAPGGGGTTGQCMGLLCGLTYSN